LFWCQSERQDCTAESSLISSSDNVITDVINATIIIQRDSENEGVYVLEASNSFGRAISPAITLRLAG